MCQIRTEKSSLIAHEGKTPTTLDHVKKLDVLGLLDSWCSLTEPLLILYASIFAGEKREFALQRKLNDQADTWYIFWFRKTT